MPVPSLAPDDRESRDARSRIITAAAELIALEVFSNQMLVALGEKGVKTLDDLADLAGDELVEILGAEAVDEATANEVIMAARAHWFAEDGEPAAEAAPQEEAGASND